MESAQDRIEVVKPSRVRFAVVAMLFIVSAFSYGDRVALSIAGITFSKDLHLDPLRLGYLFSGFSWAYVLAQLPAGGMLDRFGCKRVYGYSILAWSLCAFLVGWAGYLPAAYAFTAIFVLRLASGVAQAPVFPGNGRIVAAWFPAAERGRASAIFNSSQYFAVVLFSPALGWITHRFGWRSAFWFLGATGAVLVVAWFRTIYDVRAHPRIRSAEVEHIESGGGLGSIGGAKAGSGQPGFSWLAMFGLFRSRLLVGIYLGQFCIVTLTWFFLTWFPIYLSKARHMSLVDVGLVSALPALCGFTGGILGGVTSDKLLKAGRSLTVARKTPIVIGMCLAMTMILCNDVSAQWAVVALMSLAFFGKGFGALGWVLVSDTSPVGMTGLNGGVFNLIGNLAGITTPIVIGYIVKRTGSFHYVLIFVGVTAMGAMLSYLAIAGPIRRLEASEVR